MVENVKVKMHLKPYNNLKMISTSIVQINSVISVFRLSFNKSWQCQPNFFPNRCHTYIGTLSHEEATRISSVVPQTAFCSILVVFRYSEGALPLTLCFVICDHRFAFE